MVEKVGVMGDEKKVNSIDTSVISMSIRELYTVKLVSREDIKEFIEKWHYSGSINGCQTDYCFGLYDTSSVLVGAMFYGKLAMANQYKRFAQFEWHVIELRRLCCINDTPKNTESYFIGATLRWLKRNTLIKVVVSYADKEYGHEGIIYQASNFRFMGFRKGARVIMYGGQRYHDKVIRTNYKGELKPFAKEILKALANNLAWYKETKGKNCYTYRLRD